MTDEATVAANTTEGVAPETSATDTGGATDIPLMGQEATQQVEAATPTEPATTDFRTMLPQDLRDDSTLSDIKDVESLAKSYVNAQRMLGGSVRIPGEDASQEQLNEFYSKLEKIPGVTRTPDPENPEAIEQFYKALGRPETPDEYTIDLNGAPLDESRVDMYKKAAYEAGLTQAQMNKLAEVEAASIKQVQEASHQQRVYAEQALREKWGSDFDNRLSGAKAALEYLCQSDQGSAEQLASIAGNNPLLIQLLSDMGQRLTESGVNIGARMQQYGMSSEEAIEKINEIKNNHSHPYFDSSHKEHSEAVERVKQLYAIAYPQG